MDDNWEHVISLICGDLLQIDNKSIVQTKLEIADELTLLSKEKSRSLDALTGQINTAISTSKHRLQGLLLLQSLVPQCSSQVFQNNALSWIRLLTQALQSYDLPLTLILTCRVTGQVLRHASTFPQLNREFSSQHIPQLISVLLDAKPQWLAASIQCLTCCLQTFHGPCGPFKNKIENLLLKQLQENPLENIEVISDCLAWLCQAGGGGNMGVKHVEAWTAHCDRLLVSIHNSLGLLFQGMETESFDFSDKDAKPLFHDSLIPDAEPERTLRILDQVTALMTCLRKMIELDLPVRLRVPATDILDLLWRVAAVTDKRVLQRVTTQERLLLCSILPKLQKEAFVTLEQLIVGCGTSIAVHCATINRLFLQTLNSTVTKVREYGHERLYSSLRESVYSALARWLQVAGASSGVETIAADLLRHLIDDAKAEVDTVKVNAKGKKKNEQPLNPGKRKKGSQSDLGQLTTLRKLNVTANSHVCRAALQVLRTLLIKTGSILPVKHHQNIQEFVVHTLLDIQQSESTPLPYACPMCRHALYGLLQGSVLVPRHDWPPPTQVAITILRSGMRDMDLEVSQFCSEALVICDPILRPRAPPMRAPLPAVVTMTTDKVDSIPAQQDSLESSAGAPGRVSTSLLQDSKQPEAMSVDASLTSEPQFSEPRPGTSADPNPYETPLPESSEEEEEEEEESDDESEPMEEKIEKGLNGEVVMETGLGKQETEISTACDDVISISKSVEPANVHEMENNNKLVDEISVNSVKAVVDKLKTNGVAQREESEQKEGLKRKIDKDQGGGDAEEEPVAKKQETDEADLMLAAFVDAGPDSE